MKCPICGGSGWVETEAEELMIKIVNEFKKLKSKGLPDNPKEALEEIKYIVRLLEALQKISKKFSG